MDPERSGKNALPDNIQDELESLPHEMGDIPMTAWLLSFTGAAIMFARYGITILWQNYLQNPPGSSASPGALGLGESKASTIQYAYLVFQYLTPLPFAIISDMWIGRYKTVLISLSFVVIGYIVLVITAVPVLLERGSGLGGFVVAMVFIGLGTGGLSAVFYPIIADQIPDTRPEVVKNNKGVLVVIDRKLTIQYVYNAYYWMVNVASLSTIATTLLEKHVGFWAAYLLPTAVLVISCLPLIFWKQKLVKAPPQPTALPNIGRILLCACRERLHLSGADPEYQLRQHGRVVPWTAAFVDETMNNIISQAGQTEQHGLSNDTLQVINPIACILLGPVFQHWLFPFLRRRNVSLGPIRRISVGFLFISAGISYAAGFQALIYSRGPCYRYPLNCGAVKGLGASAVIPNRVNVWIQTPLHFLLAAGEILAMVSVNEYIQHEAPSSTKALVRALQEMAAVVGSVLGIALGVVSTDPYLTILFASLAAAMVLCAVFFYLAFRRYDAAYEREEEPVLGNGNDEKTG
ncbi:oligopeptide transporter [Xylariaceae sp. FL0594]|nr:oligopeptide transporter [Xylariaceae sp. FL0594]